MKTGGKNKNRLQNEKGMALLETIPILVVFFVLLAYGLGLFGVVHTGILNSISARAYAFETFRNRANLVYFRDRPLQVTREFSEIEVRVHAISSENTEGVELDASLRPIAVGRAVANVGTSQLDHNVKIVNKSDPRFRKGEGEASPAWIMVGYGICLNANCGD